MMWWEIGFKSLTSDIKGLPKPRATCGWCLLWLYLEYVYALFVLMWRIKNWKCFLFFFFLPAGLVVLFKGVTQNVTFRTLSKNQAVHGSHQCYCESILKVSVLKCPSNRHHKRHGQFSSVLSSLSMFYPNLLLRDQYKAL